MLLIISPHNQIPTYISGSSLPVFAYLRAPGEIDSSFPISPRAIIIHECADAEGSSQMCASLKERFPDIPVGVILNEKYARASLFRYVKNADCELISPFQDEKFKDFLKKLNVKYNTDRFSPTLTCSATGSALLGYDLGLSDGENRILLLLVTFNEHIFPARFIQEICFFSDEGSVRVLIDRVNKKAKSISGRPLILSHYGKGYSINPNP